MEDIRDNLDYSAYVIRVRETKRYNWQTRKMEDSEPEIAVYVHSEVKADPNDPKDYVTCEECFNEEIPGAKIVTEDGYMFQVHPEGMRFWFSKEVAQDHDWPHQDFTFCGVHMRRMAEQKSNPEAGTNIQHHNNPLDTLPPATGEAVS